MTGLPGIVISTLGKAIHLVVLFRYTRRQLIVSTGFVLLETNIIALLQLRHGCYS